MTRKIPRPLSPEVAVAMLEQYRAFPLALTDYPLLIEAIDRSLRFKISFWDGAILAAAETLGAGVLYTEDLSKDQLYGPILVRNPFLD